AVCAIMLITSFVVLRFTIGFTIAEEFREIGVMKAVGIGNGSIRSLYIVKYLAIAAVGALIGFFCSMPLSSAVSAVSACLSLGTSIRTPAASISRSTGTKGNSTSLYSFHKSVSALRAFQSGSLYGLNATSGLSKY
ncbi:MAG: FtsX-like permease family protein, partial [Clostridia bacterium]|nr:FtsX-like permease family protein [Clostridia bacterium]